MVMMYKILFLIFNSILEIWKSIAENIDILPEYLKRQFKQENGLTVKIKG